MMEQIKSQDWRPQTGDTTKSVSIDDGDIWIVDCLAPFDGTEQMIVDLKTHVFAGRWVKWRNGNGVSECGNYWARVSNGAAFSADTVRLFWQCHAVGTNCDRKP